MYPWISQDFLGIPHTRSDRRVLTAEPRQILQLKIYRRNGCSSLDGSHLVCIKTGEKVIIYIYYTHIR